MAAAASRQAAAASILRLSRNSFIKVPPNVVLGPVYEKKSSFRRAGLIRGEQDGTIKGDLEGQGNI